MENNIEGLKRKIDALTAELKYAKKYGLVWDKETTAEDVVTECNNNIPILNFDEEKTIELGSNNNILIEGDNYHSLVALNYCEKNSFDMIYIDPPYNTGKEDFVFNDKFINENDEYKHSKWLNFMEKRLKLSRELLKEDGYILISIDDNEYAQLKLLCDQIYGPNDYVATYFWKKTDTPPSLSNKVRKKYEYILCYGKQVDSNHKFSQGKIDGGDAPLTNTGNPYKSIVFPKGSVHFTIPDGVYGRNGKYKIKLLNDVIVENGTNINEFTAEGEWKWKQETLDDEIKGGTYFLVKSPKFSIRYQRKENDSVKTPQNNLNSDIGVGTNEEASKELEKIFLQKGIFDYPKPTSLIKFLIRMVNKDNNIRVLDFFAGSGTTGQAILELNQEDGGNRSFVLCTDNSKSTEATGDYLYSIKKIEEKPNKTSKAKYKAWVNKVEKILNNKSNNSLWNDEYEKYGIAQRITYPRLKTILTGKRHDNTVFSDGIKENLYYLKTGFISDSNNTNQAKYELVEKIDPLLCMKENIFKKISSNEYSSHYFNGNKHLFIYNDIYNQKKFEEFKNRVINETGEKIVYIFSFDNCLENNEFEDDNVTVKPIPSKIYEIYKEIANESRRGQ